MQNLLNTYNCACIVTVSHCYR